MEQKEHDIKLQWIIVFILICLIVFICFGTVCIKSNNYIKENKKNINNLLQNGGELGAIIQSFDSNETNLHGKIYSLDGKLMSRNIDLTSGNPFEKTDAEKGLLYCSTESYYAPVIGYSYTGAEVSDYNKLKKDVNYYSEKGGMLANSNVIDILTANDAYINKHNVTGDSIVTTIVSYAQQKAVEELEFFDGKDGNGFGTLAVVNYDGAVLVNASNISQDNVKMFKDEEGKFINNSVENPAYYISEKNAFDTLLTGSSFKPVTARVLIENDDKVSEEWSLIRNDSFEENSSTLSLKNKIYVGNYDGYDDSSNASLAKALIKSSNTYFFRHAENFGLTEYKKQLGDLLMLDRDIDIIVKNLDGLKNNMYTDDVYECYLPFGQGSELSPVRLASTYNHIFSGKFYAPFQIAKILFPDGTSLYEFEPKETVEKNLDIDLKNDKLIQAMSETFEYYVNESDLNLEFSSDLLYSGRLLAKSGTALLDDQDAFENRTMAITLLSEDKSSVICSSVIAVKKVATENTFQGEEASNTKLIERVLNVFYSLGVL